MIFHFRFARKDLNHFSTFYLTNINSNFIQEQSGIGYLALLGNKTEPTVRNALYPYLSFK